MGMSDYDFTTIPWDRIVHLGQIRMLDSDLFTVSWLLGRYCNYRCSYCWKHGRSDKKDHRETELCLKIIDSIKEQARANGFNSFNFSFSGGEPILHPGYFDILNKLAQDKPDTNYTSIHMTTNLSKNLPWFKEYITYAKQFDRATITASYHIEHAKKKPFADKLLYLKSNGVHVTINIVMVPEIFDKLWEVAQYFHSKELNVTLKPQSDPYAEFVVEYTQDQSDILHNKMKQKDGKMPAMRVRMKDDENNTWYLDEAERFNAFDFNNFKGWECASGYRNIIIREPCGSVKRSHSCNEPAIGHVETGFKLHDKPQVCVSSTRCVSSADSKVPKRRRGCKLPL